jgi:putative heme iron utilization protein
MNRQAHDFEGDRIEHSARADQLPVPEQQPMGPADAAAHLEQFREQMKAIVRAQPEVQAPSVPEELQKMEAAASINLPSEQVAVRPGEDAAGAFPPISQAA